MTSKDLFIKNLIRLIKERELDFLQIEIDKIIKNQEIPLPVIIDLAIFSTENGFYDESETIFKKLKNAFIKDVRIFYNLGLLYSHKKNYLEALDEFECVLEIHPNDTSTLINKGATLNDLGYFDRALEVLEKAISISPSIAQAWSKLAYRTII